MDHAEPEVWIFIVIGWRVAGDGDASGTVDGASRDAFIDLDGIGVVGDRFEQVLVMPLAFLEGLFGAMPLNSVSNRTDQDMAVDLSLYQVILSAFANGLHRHGL